MSSAGGYFADPPEARPRTVQVLRVLLWADAALTAALVVAGLCATGASTPVLAHLLVMSWPGAVAGTIAVRLGRQRRAHVAWLFAAAGWQVAMAVLETLDGDPRGLTSLLLPASIGVLVAMRPVRTYVGGRARRSYGDTGATTLEYAGLITLAALILGGLVALGLPTQVHTATRSAVCTIIDRSGCGDQPTRTRGATPPSARKAGFFGLTPPKCTGVLQCAWKILTTDPHDVAKNVHCDGIGHCIVRGAFEFTSSGWNLDKAILEDVKGIGDVLAHPSGLIDAATYIYDHPGDAARQLIWDDESATQWNNGNYTGAVSREIWNLGSWLIPGGQLGKAMSKLGKFGKLAKLADEAGKLGRLSRASRAASKAAGRAERLARKGDAKGARSAANEARRNADDAARQARREGCAVALPAAGSVRVFPHFGRFGAAALPACAMHDDRAARDAEKAADRAGSKAWEAALNDPYSMAGMDPEDVRKMIPSDWTRSTARRGGGIRYENPHRKGEQVIVERPWSLRPGQTPNVHHGDYLRISKNGKVRRVPLKGNPDPTHWDPP